MRSICKGSVLAQRLAGAALALAVDLTLLAGDASARVQRMVFAPQRLQIAPGAASTAEAFCLDFAGEIPEAKQAFRYAPGGDLGNVSVRAGGRLYPLQDWINHGKISIEGTGDFESLIIINHTNQAISFEVDRPSVVARDTSYQTKDLHSAVQRLTPVAGGNSGLSQPEVWHQRALDQARSLGFDPADVDGRSLKFRYPDQVFEADVAHMEQYQLAVLAAMKARPPKGIIVQRVEDPEDGAPLFLLYSGQTRPLTFRGESSLGELGNAARQAWSRAGGSPPPALTFVGDGDVQDLQAAMLTLAIKAREATEPNGRPAAAFSFQKPAEFADIDSFSGKLSRLAPPEITRQAGYWVGQQRVGHAIFTVYAKTAEALAQILAYIRATFNELLENDESMDLLSQAQKLQLISDLKADAEEILHRAYSRDSSLQSREGKKVRIDVTLDGQATSIEISDIQPVAGSAYAAGGARNELLTR
jgi:hypothetical protein